MSQDNQQRRLRPQRRNRGVRPQQNEEQRKEEDQIYNQIFGDLNQSSGDDESFQQQIGLRPLETYSANFANYNYGRGYHYFFNLDTFPRVAGSPSYAYEQNRFKYTYSRDHQIINGIPLNKLLNRYYIGLPTSQTTFGNSANKDKNVCNYYLFETEDQKYYNHRLIAKYKCILKNLDKLNEKNYLRNFTQLKRDAVMHEVCEENTSFQRRREILQNRIRILQERVKNMSPEWSRQDKIYFSFANDQIFHNEALAKGQRLSERNLKQRIFRRLITRKQEIQGVSSMVLGAQKPKNAIENWLVFEQQKNNILSQSLRARLKNSVRVIQTFRLKQELIIMPLFIFRFGDSQRAVDSLMKANLEEDYETGFYIYKSFIKKLFRRQLACQDEAIEQPILTGEYLQIMKQKLQRIQQFYEEEEIKESKAVILDELVQLSDISNVSSKQKVHLLNPGTRTEITLKQLMLLFFYRNISIALGQFIDYINHDPEILKLMADPTYKDFHYGIAKIVHQHQFCILVNDITRFANMLSNTNISSMQFDQKLFFNFDSRLKVAYVWTEAESDEWETEKEDNDDVEENVDDNSMRDVFEYGDPKPSKKVKLD